MQIGKQIRSGIGIALSAAMLLSVSLIGAGSANAVEETNVNTTGTDGKITITSDAGHKLDTSNAFRAIRIGAYGHATSVTSGGATKIAGVEIKETGETAVNDYDAGVPATFNLDTVIADTVQSVLGSSHTLTNDEKANPMGYVARHWLGYAQTDSSETVTNGDTESSDMYKNGLLRKFATELQSNSKIKALFTDGLDSDGVYDTPMINTGDTSVDFTSLKEGIYLIESDPAGAKVAQSIPMIVGSTVGSAGLKKFSTGDNDKLGEVLLKAETPFISKVHTSVDGTAVTGNVVPNVNIGSTVEYKITAVVPNTTGFSNYYYELEDSPTAMGFDGADPVLTVAGTATTYDTVTDVETATPTSGIAYQKTGSGNTQGFKMRFTDIATRFNQGDQIVLTFKMKVTDNGSKNTGIVRWSNNVNDATGHGEAKVDAVNPDNAPAPPTPGHPSEPTPTTVHHNYTNSFDISVKNLYRPDTFGNDPTKLEGAIFTVEKSTDGGTTFSNLNMQRSTVAGKDGEWGPSLTSTSNEVQVGTGNEAGTLLLRGLPAGIYRITQTKAATDHHMVAGKPVAVVKIANAENTDGDTHDAGGALTAVTRPELDAMVKATLLKQGTTDFWGLVTPSAATADQDLGHDTANVAQTGDVKIQNVDSIAQLPMTGGAGIILIAALVLICGSVAAGTSVLRRKNRLNSMK
ncbi:isopeptide-forming domain-containing fimbrial protein [Bifidobacterium sp. ESL0690]|uniref:isopeptide-forming domain-containing fimbrial protein n=1 Tax=Bifidobacterium sp. ESL0690 TaxID=2983214 RepID=UPI0023F84890|nr:isopeptide-forming domain-containing fimbrial protein [Bifidobacterium sp. ESL0690]WEV46708.1 isopeptide-forming domain-containing fimbrial protein [Bifidobacterium sp. ESL0690]